MPPFRVAIRRLAISTLVTAALVTATGCRQAMYNDAKLEPLVQSDFFANGLSARPLVPGTVARGFGREDPVLSTGVSNGVLVAAFPAPVTRGLLERGQERYTIYCAVCHGYNGHGNGMIVQRGFPVPPSFHEERLRNVPPGYIVYVIAHGYGVMYSYANRVEPEDRWAIAAYIGALQLSHRAPLEVVPPAEQVKLQKVVP